MATGKLYIWIHCIILWNVLEIKARKVECSSPPVIRHAVHDGPLDQKKFKLGAMLRYKCEKEFSLNRDAISKAWCVGAGWVGPDMTCAFQCQVPVITSATVVGLQESVYVDHNTEVQYQCDSGLVPRGSPNMKCYNGTWSGSVECVPAPCPSAPPHVHNGIRIYMGQVHGSRAKYECFAGFQLTGMDGTYLTCEFGFWNGGRPHCLEYVASKDVSELEDSTQQLLHVENDVQPPLDNSTDESGREFDGSSSVNDTGSAQQSKPSGTSEGEVYEAVSDMENCSSQKIQLEFNQEIENDLKMVAQIGNNRVQELVNSLIEKIRHRNELIRTADSSTTV